LEAGQAGRGEAFAPLAHGVPVAIELLGELLVREVVGGGVEDETTTESQSLGGGAGTDQGLELLT
jgi:hypothetical protein